MYNKIKKTPHNLYSWLLMSRNVVSFDVGIKNLSFFILELINNELTINKWEVVDLCNEKIRCIETVDNKQCIKLAKYHKDNQYYCQTHCKKKQYHVPPDHLREKSLQKMKLEELIKMTNELHINIEKPYTKNKVLEKIYEYMSHKYFEPIVTIKANDFNLVDLGINLRDKLDILLDFNSNKENDIDLVLIENQISPIANRMKTVQGMIAQYLIMRGVQNIIFYSATNKLKTFIGTDKTSYSERKQLSISYTTQILTKTTLLNSWQQLFIVHKKKDDLADSFLQGLSYLIQKYNLKIEL